MNSALKTIIILLNAVALLLAVLWFNKQPDYEPGIVIITQFIVLLGMLFERQVSNIITHKIRNKSRIHTDVVSGDHVSVKDVDDSEVNIKTH